eukprot:1195527-Prorocentrum_minimum.AAC.3
MLEGASGMDSVTHLVEAGRVDGAGPRVGVYCAAFDHELAQVVHLQHDVHVLVEPVHLGGLGGARHQQLQMVVVDGVR